MSKSFESPGEMLRATQPRIAVLARSITVGVLAGFLAGMLTGGLGSRVVMRISGMAAGSGMQGVLTEQEAVVGEITGGGTFFLIFFGGFLGVIGGLTYAGIRPWVAGAGKWRGVFFGVFLLATLGWVIIEGDNQDFHLFGPPLLNIALFASLFILFGVAVSPLFDWIAGWLPPLSFRRRIGFLILPTSFSLPSLFSLVAHGFGFFIAVLIGAAVSFGFGEGGNTREFLRFVGIYVLLIPAIASVLLARHVGGFQQLSDLRRYPGALAVAWAVLTPPVVVGGVLIALALIQIFAASG